MHTTLFLVRHGDTEWAAERRLLGRRDVGLSLEGRRQAEEAAVALAPVPIAEVLSSPLLRAVETAEGIAAAHRLDVSRDARLADADAGRWEGMRFEELRADREYQQFVHGDVDRPTGGESLGEVCQRAVASVEQAVHDNPVGANLVLVTHAMVVRLLLAHYLGIPLQNYHQFRVAPGSFSVLRYGTDRAPTRVLAVSQGVPLSALLR